MSILYFAYGSNMVTSRMQERVASARIYGIGCLRGWNIVCNKRSKDGSAKANLIKQENAAVWGVLYEVDETELARLDRFEGGYQRVTVSVHTDQNTMVAAQTYISDDLADQPVAYDTYKDLIIAGAEEHHLPADYIAQLNQLPARKYHHEDR